MFIQLISITESMLQTLSVLKKEKDSAIKQKTIDLVPFLFSSSSVNAVICSNAILLLLKFKGPQISKPQRTVARNANPIRNGERKKP